ncbi:ABC transporter substrate-binding protein [Acuticoccus kandeliae]|uniref:ABC transporter substrate-binding protein n=1 Tax=Acuticoccus kandeliae TaxID=2073160 RepID=UPI001300648C|nr:ABC transporter substrate-binding protein [Acuticoccus kandeliae]
MTDSRTTGHGACLSRRSFLASAAGVAASASLPRTAGAQAGIAPARVLTFSDHEPLGGMRTRFLKDVVFPAIERESDGRLKVNDHWNGEIAAAYDALGAVSRTGGPDMATTVPEYTAKELPLHQIFKSFPTGPTGSRQVDFFRRAHAEIPAFTAEFERNDIVPLFFGTGYPVAFFSTSPLADLGGLKDGRWRSASFWHLDFLKNAGATPVRMHWGPEIYDALKARTLDGLMVNVDSGYMLNVHEAAPSILVSKDLWLGHVYPLAMNRSVWDGLEPQDRRAIQRAAATSYQSLGAVMDASFEAQLDDLRRAGADVRILDADEVERWKTATRYRDVQSAWARAQESEGVADAGAVLASVTDLMDEMIG